MTLDEINKKFADEVREVDDVAQIVLKGHLVMEGLMTEAIETFVLHADFVETVRLQVHLAGSRSPPTKSRPDVPISFSPPPT